MPKFHIQPGTVTGGADPDTSRVSLCHESSGDRGAASSLGDKTHSNPDRDKAKGKNH